MDKSEAKNKDIINLMGEVTEALPNTMFRVKVQEGPEELIGKTVLCTLNGKMRRFRIRVMPGDKVLAEMSIYDLNRGRITRRLRDHEISQHNSDQAETTQDKTDSENPENSDNKQSLETKKE